MRIQRASLVCVVLLLAAATAMAAEGKAKKGKKAKKPGAAKEAVELFNGKNLDGWGCFLVKEGVKLEDVWSVSDGILVCKGEPHGYLCTEGEYENFRLHVEWRWAPGKEAGNSGVLMRITGKEMMLPNCVEAQLKSGDAGAMYGFQGFKIDGDEERKFERAGGDLTGDMVGLRKIEAAENEPGEWNTYDIVCRGDKIVLRVNGKKVNEAEGCDVRAGKIGLQSEGGEIHFRKVAITPFK